MRKFIAVNAKHRLIYNFKFSTANWLVELYFYADFFTIFGVPLAGESYWSSWRRYAAETHLPILQPKGNKR